MYAEGSIFSRLIFLANNQHRNKKIRNKPNTDIQINKTCITEKTSRRALYKYQKKIQINKSVRIIFSY